MKKYILTIVMLLCVTFSCVANNDRDSIFLSHWDQPECWFQSQAGIDKSKVDVFYITSTNVLESSYPDGSPSMRATLTDQDLKALSAENAFVRDSMFYNDFNFFAPYYHQFNYTVLTATEADYQKAFNEVVIEVYDAFEYYMKHKNNGRHFILAGFSQGAMMVTELLKRMTEEEFQRMVAAYVIGYRLSKDDLKYPYIKAAKNATDKHVAVSFNSAFTREALWPVVADGAAKCINPVNWKTNSTLAEFSFRGKTLKVHVDEKSHALIVDGDKTYFHNWMNKYPFLLNAGASIDNLHHWDLLFYTHHIHDNAVLRSKK